MNDKDKLKTEFLRIFTEWSYESIPAIKSNDYELMAAKLTERLAYFGSKELNDPTLLDALRLKMTVGFKREEQLLQIAEYDKKVEMVKMILIKAFDDFEI